MQNTSSKVTKFLLLVVGLASAHCSSSGAPTAPPTPIATQAVDSISDVVDYGIVTPGLIEFELDGTFVGTGDSVFVSCAASGNPIASVVSDSSTEILFTLPTSGLVNATDTCNFSIQNNGTFVTAGSTPISVSSTQVALNITQVTDSGPDSSPADGYDDIVLTGSFAGTIGGGDLVFASCDGATSFTQAQAPTSDGQDGVGEIVVAIPTPQNIYSCQFFVAGNTVQTPVYATLGITNAQDVASSSGKDTIVLYGSFVATAGGGDQVWAECDSATSFTQIPNLITDGYGKIEFLMPTPIDFTTCQFYIVGAGVQSQTY